MRPTFSSRRHAGLFGLLLVVLIALPILLTPLGSGRDRRPAYSDIPNRLGSYRWVQSQMDPAKGPIDIAFVGSSRMLMAIDTPYIQGELEKSLGRPANVITISWNFAGFDGLYHIARDLLAARRVDLMVVCDEYSSYAEHPYPDYPHLGSLYWHRWGDNPEARSGLSPFARFRLYAVSVLGAPRQLATRLIGNSEPALRGPHVSLIDPGYQAGDIVEQRGAARTRLGYDWKNTFVPAQSPNPPQPTDARIYSDASSAGFSFVGPASPEFQRHYARQVAGLCRDRQTRLVLLHIPALTEKNLTTVAERERPEELFGRPVPLVGVPPEKLFAGLDAGQLRNFYVDDVHLNLNGQQLFTPTLAPSLLKLYAAKTTSQ